MPLAEGDEMVQGLVFNRLHKPLDPCIEIRRPGWQHLRLDVVALQKLLEFGRELGVSIMNQAGGLLIPVGNVVYECFRLFCDPGRIRTSR